MRKNIDEAVAFADTKVSEAFDAVSNQITLIFLLSNKNIRFSSAQSQLDALNDDLRQWRSYRNLLHLQRRSLTDA